MIYYALPLAKPQDHRGKTRYKRVVLLAFPGHERLKASNFTLKHERYPYPDSEGPFSKQYQGQNKPGRKIKFKKTLRHRG